LSNIVNKINEIDISNDNLRAELTDLVPTALRNMKKGLEPYQEFLKRQKEETIKKAEENSKIIDTVSIILTIVNIVILLAIAYWTKYELVEKIKYLKAKYKELQDTQSQLIQSEKMASLGGMVAGVAHEINTPIGMALTAITNLEDETKELKKSYDKEEMTQEDFDDYLVHSMKLNKSININLNKAATLVRSFKQVAVDQTSDHDRKFEFHEYVDEILQSLHSKIKKTKLKVEVNIDKDISIYSNPGAFSQILSNFIINSIIHGFSKDQEGLIKIEAVKNNDDFILKYSDNGKGLTKKTKQKIFDPFYTTNRANGGSGLGMNIVYNLVTQKLHGTIDVKSAVGEGVEFIIKAPLHYKK
jgi:signal transduction histidine kinase